MTSYFHPFISFYDAHATSAITVTLIWYNINAEHDSNYNMHANWYLWACYIINCHVSKRSLTDPESDSCPEGVCTVMQN